MAVAQKMRLGHAQPNELAYGWSLDEVRSAKCGLDLGAKCEVDHVQSVKYDVRSAKYGYRHIVIKHQIRPDMTGTTYSV